MILGETGSTGSNFFGFPLCLGQRQDLFPSKVNLGTPLAPQLPWL
jgi:hypothetical protein